MTRELDDLWDEFAALYNLAHPVSEQDRARIRDAILAAAGPRDYKRGPCVHGNPCRESMCVEYGRSDAAAGPRAEGLDVERLARAMQNVEDELTATNIASEYAALGVRF